MVTGYAASSGLLGTTPITPSSVNSSGPVVANQFFGAVSTTAVATGASGTIATNVGVSRISPAAARTACVLTAGLASGQMVIVINEATGANSITFDVAGTSNVADGATTTIAGLRSAWFVWDAATALWYRGA